MRHFIAYHNRDKMGGPSRPCQFHTNKTFRDLIGSVVWIVEGVERSPKQYKLVSWFIVRKLEKSLRSGFKTAGYGDGYEFKEHVQLNGFDWFPDFRRRMGNFGFGLQPVRDEEVVSHLEGFAAKRETSGCRATNGSDSLDA